MCKVPVTVNTQVTRRVGVTLAAEFAVSPLGIRVASCASALILFSLGGCSDTEPEYRPPAGHFRGNELFRKAYAAPTKLLENAASDREKQVELNKLVLRRCDDLERYAP